MAEHHEGRRDVVVVAGLLALRISPVLQRDVDATREALAM
jgi:hypothetical protein